MELDIYRSLTNRHIPQRMHDGIARFILYGVRPGSFLWSVICNDLKSAVAHADDDNIRLLPEYVRFFYNDAPSQCWGSEEKAVRWVNQRGLSGQDKGRL